MAMSVARVNYWPDSRCARAFWGQQEIPPYRRLLADTALWLEPRADDHWLDLGCGSGQLTKALWSKSCGQIGRITSVDVAAENEIAINRMRRNLTPPDEGGRIQFCCGNISEGLARWPDRSVDGIVSGLAIQYAESYSEALGRFTTEAYDRLLREVWRVLKPGRTFVFSVNVPEPAWRTVALHSLAGVFVTRRPARYLGRSLRMMRYGRWLKREARTGRFHFLRDDIIRGKLLSAGFTDIEHRLTYAGQAYVFRCRRPDAA
jgi:ubiquinone/menaquinone biosynthesis C-methylase UbiE